VSEELPWRCFHCDEVFATKDAASDHFGDGNYEGDMPLCIEAATSEMQALVLTNREMFRELLKARDEAEQAEFVAHCWEEAARMFLKQPNATWHDLASFRETAEGRVLAAEAAINAAPRWLADLLRRRSEKLWRKGRAALATPNNDLPTGNDGGRP
jgi:hypothetical protein